LVGILTYVGVRALPRWPKRLPLGPLALVGAACAANLPDLDMAVSLALYGDHGVLHGNGTHSLAFPLLAGALVWWIARRRRAALGCAGLAFALVGSHIAVDWITGPKPGTSPAHGVMLFWPFDEVMVRAPVTLFKGVVHRDLFPGALVTACWELLILGPPTVLAVLASARNTSHEARDSDTRR
jgi:membrane-bound metal-dependent hydrolase YbcI (DUF457 family)